MNQPDQPAKLPQSLWNRSLIRVLVVVAVVFIVYLPTRKLGWIWDDDQYVYLNPNLHSLSGLYRIWFVPSASPQYYPVVFSGLWLQHQLFGLNPAPFHLTNAALHAMASGLLLMILERLKLRASLWIALAFGLHPVQVESVAWITELKNVLSGLFYALSWLALWPVVTADSSPLANTTRRAVYDYRLWLGFLCFICALLSKSVTASLPAGLLVALWFRQGNLRLRQLAILVPLLCVGAVAGWNTARLEKEHVGAEGADWAYSFLDRCGIAARSIVHYATNLFFPTEQIFFYPRFNSSIQDIQNWISLIAVAAIVVLTLALAWRGWRGPFAGVSFFAGTAFPALGFLNVYPHRFSFVADHFIYIASAGLLTLIISGVYVALSAISRSLKLDRLGLAISLPMALLCGCYALQVQRYLPAYTNEFTHWHDTLAKNPHCPAALQNLGLRYSDANQPEQALTILQRALEYDFDRFQTYNSLGVVYRQLGQLDRSRASLETSLKLKPNNPRAMVNMANLLRLQSKQAGDQQMLLEALAWYQSAWDEKPDYLAAFGLATCNYELKRLGEAARWFEAAYDIQPDDIDALYNHAQTLAELGELERAVAVTEKLVEAHPRDADAKKLRQELKRRVRE